MISTFAKRLGVGYFRTSVIVEVGGVPGTTYASAATPEMISHVSWRVRGGMPKGGVLIAYAGIQLWDLSDVCVRPKLCDPGFLFDATASEGSWPGIASGCGVGIAEGEVAALLMADGAQYLQFILYSPSPCIVDIAGYMASA